MLPEFRLTDDMLHDYWVYYHNARKPFAPWLEHDDCIVVANSILILLKRAIGMLNRQLKVLGDSFLENGGFKERMYQCRSDSRGEQTFDKDAPECPVCSKKMRKRFPRNGNDGFKPFWGCGDFPKCKGTRKLE